MRQYLQFILSNKAMLSFGCLCVFWGNFGQSFYLGWYGDPIMQELGLSASDYGLTYSLATLGSGLSIMWIGGLIDHWSLRKFVIVVGLGLCAACLVLSQVHTVWVLGIGFFLIRLFGQGLLPHTGITTMAKVFDQNRGKAISMATSGVPIGEVILPATAVFLIAMLGWQGSWLVAAAATAFLFLPLVLSLLKLSHRALPELSGPNSGAVSKKGRWLVLGDLRFWFAAPILLACPFVLTGIFIQQGFVLKQKDWSPEWMATSFMVYGVFHWLGALWFGILVDKYSGAQLLRVYVLPLLVGLFLLANVAGWWMAPIIMALLGASNGASSPVIGSLWAEMYGPAVIGGVRSAVSSVVVLSTAVSPVLFGLLIDYDVSLQSMMNGFTLLFALSLLLLFFSYRPQQGAPV